MKTKRVLAVVLVACLALSCTCAQADIGDWLKDAWDDASGWVSQAWKDASGWINNAWGDASKWVEQAWNDSSAWATDIWGDVSTWATETYENASDAVSAWWSETFDTVTKTKNIWEWLGQATQEVRTLLGQKYQEIMSSEQEGMISTSEKLKEIYNELLKRLNLNDEDSGKVMKTIEAFAAEKGISAESLQIVLLPYLTQLVVDSEESGHGSIPAIAVAQYLTGIVEKEGINTEEQAQLVISDLDEVLKIQ